jgi:hypothetical protein
MYKLFTYNYKPFDFLGIVTFWLFLTFSRPLFGNAQAAIHQPRTQGIFEGEAKCPGYEVGNTLYFA